MSLVSTLEGNWTGIGQMYDAETKDVIDTIEVKITLDKVSDTELTGTKEMSFINDKSKNYDTGLKLEVINEMEMTFSPPWAETPITFMYMDQPVSFQGSYVSDSLGPNTRNLDNNFIVNDQWQINIEAQNDSQHVIFEYVLDKNE